MATYKTLLLLSALLVLVKATPLSSWDVEFNDDGSTTISSLRKNELVATMKVTGFLADSISQSCLTSTPGVLCRQNDLFRSQVTGDHYCMTEETYTIGDTNSKVPIEITVNMTGHLYGGSEQRQQYWPLDDVKFSDYSIVTKEQDGQGVAEPYWLSSKGYFLYVHPQTSLFIDQNIDYDNYITLRTQNKAPYPSPAPLIMNYTICAAEDARQAHMLAVEHYLGKPSGIPDERMITHPIWSTWARYKANINESVVEEFADEIIKNGFDNSQLEIDDKWETCYGSLTFDKAKFPNMKNLTDNLKNKGFRVTLWIHPFINLDCDPYHQEVLEKGYFVKNQAGNTTTKWWNGVGSIIDFTNPEAVDWWVGRLKVLQKENGIDSFKFDAGETSWLPQLPVLLGNTSLLPNLYSENYARTVAQFGSMVEARVAHNTRDLPIFIRMLDKDSRWDIDNGLPTLITTLLEMNMVGYPIVLPDMVGGNGYQGAPDKELFIRWLQANVFMPAIQYSYVPWDYDDETVEICKKFTKLHKEFSPKIIDLLKEAATYGTPVNTPIWWVDPNDTVAQEITDEYLLGEDILVAPVIKQGAVSRDIYLPRGKWGDANHPQNALLHGPVWLRDYSAGLDVLPFFIRLP